MKEEMDPFTFDEILLIFVVLERKEKEVKEQILCRKVNSIELEMLRKYLITIEAILNKIQDSAEFKTKVTRIIDETDSR